MHIVILASTPEVAERTQTALGDVADRYTIATTWSDVISLLEKDAPNLILAERAALARMELASLLKLTEASRWPPLLLVGAHSLVTGPLPSIWPLPSSHVLVIAVL